ncbi:uroporphyrinogen-III synthase [Cryobacterium sp. TMT1-62]|uniref:Uroporphyrinogen-III synthase n=1 Tax=Cryobacterium sandaracinum TaxID=1259247 RepID=A0ABY2J3G8_9MICO|nr:MULTISPECIES: uroporphyrinogen-III synthase [Cryobacterium]TFB57854.1 uroporphyrinogen-III synthase [Cryobacterium sp. Sr3]TFB61116.1 uroporphyrinogen-III synthase [Cryobacterium sp. Hz7]TFC38284.1 uroporphyrinogen-III synthase [Cryobacterium sp. TMT2-14]TFC50107.1 uroporphyrinogen-III synthase [Cryobacterium sp. TMT2-17-1]TFC69999.1 uroporphyrinogen-III synthase [Cryobacterium sp. TMT2-4]
MNSRYKTKASLAKPLTGWRVLVPRGGPWGDHVAADLRSKGAQPIVAPMINFAPTDDAPALEAALARLAAGDFDWMTVTSATTVDVLSSHRAVVAASTRIAAVGETTAAALIAAGYRVDIVPSEDNSARGLLEEWETATSGQVPLRILTLRSEIAKPLLTEGLRRIGHDVESVVAYRTIGVPVDQRVVADVAAGTVQALLVTSGSVAQQVQDQLGPIPESTVVACIGPRTARDAAAIGLRVDVVADSPSAESLIQALVHVAQSR